DIPCYTFQFVRRFGSGEEKNRTIRPQGKTVNTFSGIFLGKFVMSLSDKVFYLRQTLRRLQQPPLLLRLMRLCEYAA
ncbi:hypothetical protein, partial [Neisseria gonorrhoeae]|uniref:hypothetical protein n=1 Tax=Neisseria gonorrhoeae TaxID=485 RepID=UPI001F4D97B9